MENQDLHQVDFSQKVITDLINDKYKGIYLFQI